MILPACKTAIFHKVGGHTNHKGNSISANRSEGNHARFQTIFEFINKPSQTVSIRILPQLKRQLSHLQQAPHLRPRPRYSQVPAALSIVAAAVPIPVVPASSRSIRSDRSVLGVFSRFATSESRTVSSWTVVTATGPVSASTRLTPAAMLLSPISFTKPSSPVASKHVYHRTIQHCIHQPVRPVRYRHICRQRRLKPPLLSLASKGISLIESGSFPRIFSLTNPSISRSCAADTDA